MAEKDEEEEGNVKDDSYGNGKQNNRKLCPHGTYKHTLNKYINT